jgi:putative endonuclease
MLLPIQPILNSINQYDDGGLAGYLSLIQPELCRKAERDQCCNVREVLRAATSCNRLSRTYNQRFLWRGHSSVGRALQWHCRGQGFESPCLQPRKHSGLSRRSLSVGGPFSPCNRGRASYDSASPILMHYVYVLESESDSTRFYTGLTDDLRKRLRNHNDGRVLHTSKLTPWRLKTYVAFSDRKRAAEFEKYLKSSSGRAFAAKRL